MPSPRNPSPRNKIALSQYIFGAQALPLLASGVYSLLCPSATVEHMKPLFDGVNDGTIRAMGLTSMALGMSYAVSACQNNTPMMIATIPGRLIAFFVFWGGGDEWKRVAPFEGAMALVTAVGLYWDRRAGGI